MIGRVTRAVLGERLFPQVGALYRAIFVDLQLVVDSVPALPPTARILDIGGGDGAVLDRLLARYPESRADMIDLASSLGGSIAPERAARVRALPRCSIQDYRKVDHPRPDLIVVSDVLHHVPPAARPSFFADLRDMLEGAPTTIFVKDVEPTGWRAMAGFLADRYISGDKGVELISEAGVRTLLATTFPGATLRSTELVARDRPNYSLICEVPPGQPAS